MRRFIHSRFNMRHPVWHYGVQRGGAIVAACNGKPLGGYFGPFVRSFDGYPRYGRVCQRCARLERVPADEE